MLSSPFIPKPQPQTSQEKSPATATFTAPWHAATSPLAALNLDLARRYQSHPNSDLQSKKRHRDAPPHHHQQPTVLHSAAKP
uniref:Uncharacterized protein n=1 Tax=Fagus sylvatica TaxID=28930 RepID=A0A2N9GSB3_FAGSY